MVKTMLKRLTTKWPWSKYPITWVALTIVVNVIWGVVSPNDLMKFWLTNDQQARIYFNNKQYAQAADLYEDPMWKAYSLYLAGDFSGAASITETLPQNDALFLLANSYAHSAQLEQARALYINLQAHPDYSEQATENIKVVEDAIEKMKKNPPKKKATEKAISDSELVTDDEKKEAKPQKLISDQVWLEQVRQNPEKFLRQKFQQEYSNAQE
jgi:hypothetical protein